MDNKLSLAPLILPLTILILACSSTPDSGYSDYDHEPAWKADPGRIYLSGTVAVGGAKAEDPSKNWPYSVIISATAPVPDKLTPPSKLFPQKAVERTTCELKYRLCTQDEFWTQFVLPSANKHTPDWVRGGLDDWSPTRTEDRWSYGEDEHKTGTIKCGYEKSGSGWRAHGPAKLFDLDGRLTSEGPYRHGANYGPWHVYAGDGSVWMGCYCGGDRIGVWGKFEGGKLTELKDYEPEVANEREYQFDEQGRLKAEFTKTRYRYSKYGVSETQRHGPYRVWLPDGRLLESGEYYTGKLHGQIRHWNDEQQGRLEISTFVNGVKSGWQCVYNPQGWRWVAFQSKTDADGNSLPDGKSLEWLKDGTLYAQRRYKDGVLQGQSNTYGPKGNVTSELHYENGKLHGRYREFWPDGTVKSKGEFDSGWRVGGWMRYSKNGSLIRLTEYTETGRLIQDAQRQYKSEAELKGRVEELGMMQGKWLSWYDLDHKQKKWEADFIDNLPDGDSTEWHTNGKVASKGEYLIGIKVGDWQYWHLNGKMSAEEHYDDLGAPIGTWKSWNEHGELIEETNHDEK